MSVKLIQNLPSASSLSTGDFVLVSQGGVTKKADASLVVAPTLKTVGGVSLLGSGDISSPTFSGAVSVGGTFTAYNIFQKFDMVSNPTITRYSGVGGGSNLILTTSGSATYGVNAIPAAGGAYGTIYFGGYNGTDHLTSTLISSVNSGGILSPTNLSGSLVFKTTPTESLTPLTRMTIDHTGAVTVPGSLGMGITPSAGWQAGLTPIQTNSGMALWTIHTSQNTYFDGTNYRAMASGAATDYYQLLGSHVWRYAPSVATDAVQTFATGMSISNAGTVTIPGALAIGSLNGGQLGGFRNKLINGGFDVWQRGTSFPSASGYSADRWTYSGPVASITKQADNNATVTNYMRWATTAVTQYTNIEQYLERNEVYKLRGKPVTFRYLGRVSGAAFNGLLGCYIGFNNTTDASGTTPTTFAYGGHTVPTPAVWGWHAITVTVPMDAVGMFVQCNVSEAQANAGVHVDIACCQLEEGSVATPFETRPYSVELAMCQRYLRPLFNATGVAWSVAAAELISWGVPMRATPTLSVSTGYTILTSNNQIATLSVVSSDTDGSVHLSATSSGMAPVGAGATLNGVPAGSFLISEL